MILSDKDIIKKLKEGDLVIDPFEESLLQPSSVNVALANEIRVFDNWLLGEIDVKKNVDPTRLVKIPPEGFVVHPGEFVLGSTEQKFELPNDIAGRIEGRSSLGRLGLIIHATAGFVDPGFSGWLTLEISNISKVPIRLYAGMKISQICFFEMSSPVMNPYGSKKIGSKYQGQKEPTPSRYYQEFDKQ